MFPSLWKNIWVCQICSSNFLGGYLSAEHVEGKDTIFCSQGWDDICAIFKTYYLEFSMLRCNGILLYLVRFGKFCFSTSEIWNKNLNSPAKLVSRLQSKFGGLQLATKLDKSGKLEMILGLPYYDDDLSDIVSEGNFDEDEKSLNKKSSNITYDYRCVNFKASSGLRVDANKLSLFDHFGIPVENLQTL